MVVSTALLSQIAAKFQGMHLTSTWFSRTCAQRASHHCTEFRKIEPGTPNMASNTAQLTDQNQYSMSRFPINLLVSLLAAVSHMCFGMMCCPDSNPANAPEVPNNLYIWAATVDAASTATVAAEIMARWSLGHENCTPKMFKGN